MTRTEQGMWAWIWGGRGLTRQLLPTLGWENHGVERDAGRVRRWALPVQMVPARDIAVLAGAAQAGTLLGSMIHVSRWWARVHWPWVAYVPGLFETPGDEEHPMLAWSHRPSPDWTVPSE